MSFSNENHEEENERRLRAVMKQAPIPETPSTFSNLLGERHRRRRKLAAILMSVAAGTYLAFVFLEFWYPQPTKCFPHMTLGSPSPFDPPPVDSLNLLTLDLSALEEIGKEKPQ